MKRLIFACFVLLAGCATAVLESYVGKSITEPILDYGPPVNAVDLPDGRRAFQWAVNSTGVIPVTSTNSATVWGGGTSTLVTGTTTNYIPTSSQCVYTLYARPQGDDWIVTGYREPNFNCL